jgi:hypothetical protein
MLRSRQSTLQSLPHLRINKHLQFFINGKALVLLPFHLHSRTSQSTGLISRVARTVSILPRNKTLKHLVVPWRELCRR